MGSLCTKLLVEMLVSSPLDCFDISVLTIQLSIMLQIWWCNFSYSVVHFKLYFGSLKLFVLFCFSTGFRVSLPVLAKGKEKEIKARIFIVVFASVDHVKEISILAVLSSPLQCSGSEVGEWFLKESTGKCFLVRLYSCHSGWAQHSQQWGEWARCFQEQFTCWI